MHTVEGDVNGIEIQLFRNCDDLSADARALVSQCEKRHGMQCGLEWFRLLEREVFGLDGVQWIALSQDGCTQAVWPLRGRLGAGALSNFYSARWSPAHGPGVDARLAAAMVSVLRRTGGGGVYDFAPMDPASSEFAVLEQGLRRAGLRTHRFFRFGNWFLPCAGMSWDAYLASRSSSMRSTIRRMTKKLVSDGGHIEILTAADGDVERAIGAYQSVYKASWKQPEPYPTFVPALIRVCAAQGWLRLGIAWLGDKPIAAQLWTVAQGRAEIFKVAYDDAFKSYSPGTIVSAALMEYVLTQDRVCEVDFLSGDDEYKKLWMSHRRERWGLVAFDPRTPRGVYGALRESVLVACKRIYRRASRGMAVSAADGGS